MVTAIAEDMVRLTKDMIAATDERLRSVGALVTETRATLKRFRADRSKMASDQATDLAGFAGELSKEVDSIRRKAQCLVREFGTANRQMSKEQSKRLAGFVQGLAKDVTAMLSSFEKERGALSKELGERLTGEITEIKTSVERILKEAGSFIDEQHSGMAKARQAWRHMSTALHNARKVGLATPVVEGQREERRTRPAIHKARRGKSTAAKKS